MPEIRDGGAYACDQVESESHIDQRMKRRGSVFCKDEAEYSQNPGNHAYQENGSGFQSDRRNGKSGSKYDPGKGQKPAIKELRNGCKREYEYLEEENTASAVVSGFNCCVANVEECHEQSENQKKVADRIRVMMSRQIVTSGGIKQRG